MCACLVSSVMSDSLRPYGPRPARLLCPWDSPGKNNGVGCHFLLQLLYISLSLYPKKTNAAFEPTSPTVCNQSNLPTSRGKDYFIFKTVGWRAYVTSWVLRLNTHDFVLLVFFLCKHSIFITNY